MLIRHARDGDREAILAVIMPTFRAGETYPLPRDVNEDDALAYWLDPAHEVFVVEREDRIVGSYYLRANTRGGGDHVANCGYIVAPEHAGRGVARAMCSHSLEHARARGFRAMQFNFVISTNERAVRLWQSFDFQIVGRLPGAFRHPRHGFVDALVMYRNL